MYNILSEWCWQRKCLLKSGFWTLTCKLWLFWVAFISVVSDSSPTHPSLLQDACVWRWSYRLNTHTIWSIAVVTICNARVLSYRYKICVLVAVRWQQVGWYQLHLILPNWLAMTGNVVFLSPSCYCQIHLLNLFLISWRKINFLLPH